MKELIQLVNTGYIERVTSLPMQKKVWEATTEFFRPDINLYRNIRPSVILARETGDLGLAVLWIVQTALARPILHDITVHSQDISGLAAIAPEMTEKAIISLAHSEPVENPVSYTFSGEKAILNGIKKFITAGRNSSIIMVTCRGEGSDKPDRIAFTRSSELPGGSMHPLDLKIMRTVDHTGLTLKEFQLDKKRFADADPSVIRRSLKKWGIIERALILEAFMAFLLYCNYLFREYSVTIASDDEIISVLDKQSESATRQIDESVYEKLITTQNAGINEIMKITARFQNAFMEKQAELPDEEKIRLADLFLFNSLRG